MARFSHRRQAMAQQPVDLRLAAEKEPGVLLLEHFQAAIGTFALEDGLARSRPRRDAPDAADQPVERLLVVETLLEIDPRSASGTSVGRGPAAVPPPAAAPG